MDTRPPTGLDVKLYGVAPDKKRGREKLHGPTSEAPKTPAKIHFPGPPEQSVRALAAWIGKLSPRTRASLDGISAKFTRSEQE